MIVRHPSGGIEYAVRYWTLDSMRKDRAFIK